LLGKWNTICAGDVPFIARHATRVFEAKSYCVGARAARVVAVLVSSTEPEKSRDWHKRLYNKIRILNILFILSKSM
jgi:hypothetical protein